MVPREEILTNQQADIEAIQRELCDVVESCEGVGVQPSRNSQLTHRQSRGLQAVPAPASP